MSVYEIERDDKVVVFQEAELGLELDKFVAEYRLAHPTHSMKIYELNDDMERIGAYGEYDPSGEDVNFNAELNRVANKLYNALPEDLQELIMSGELGEHKCAECNDFDICELPMKDQWIKESNEESKN